MKKSVYLIITLLFTVLQAMAQIQGIDSLFRADDLVYFSDLEKESIKEFLDGNPDYLAMISAINPATDKRELGLYRNWVDEIIDNIGDKKFNQLSDPKKIERIKSYVSKALLLTYNHKADFNDLFRFGNYNYFTAAAIYAFILDQFGIPYEIRETPTYIYLLAYPQDQRIAFETTKPGFQYFMFDHQTRENFVDFMHDQGVIEDIDYRNTSKRDLFEKYYFTDYGLSIREMIGMLYINSALDLIIRKQNKDAFSQFEKAFLLHPSYRTQYLLLAQLNTYLLEMDYHNPLDLGYLIKASRLVNYGVEREIVESFLEDIVNNILLMEEDEDGFMFIYEYLQEFIRDEDLKRNFTFYYLYEIGRISLSNAKYQKALEYSESAYLIHPDDELNQNLLVRALGGYSTVVSPGIVLEKIQQYDTAFTAILNEGIYIMVKLQAYLEEFGEAFQLRDGQKGEQYRIVFEKLLDENPDAGLDHILVGRSYSSAAIYYYRQGMVSKSRQMVEKGLIYAPDNIELKLKLASFD